MAEKMMVYEPGDRFLTKSEDGVVLVWRTTHEGTIEQEAILWTDGGAT